MKNSFLITTTTLIVGLATTLDATPQSAADSTTGTVAGDRRASFFWGDFDRDGLEDAFVFLADGSTRLLRNAGDGSFEDATGESGLDAYDTSDAHQALWSDFDGDGTLDLFLASYRSSNRLLRQTDSGTFEDVTDAAGLDRAVGTVDARWIDYDLDGRADLVLSSLEDERVLHNEGSSFRAVDLGRPSRGGALSVGEATPVGVDQARGLLGLPPVSPRGGGGVTRSTSGGPVLSGTPGSGPNTNNGTAQNCVPSIEDQSSGACMSASSVPTLGMLYPISSNWYIDAATGFTGIFTTTPLYPLDVWGTIRSAAGGYVFPDGTLQTTAQLVGPPGEQGPPGLLIGGALDQTARHDGSTWVADDTIVNTGSRIGVGAGAPASRLDVVAYSSSDVSAVRGEGSIADTFGYLGVQGKTNFDGYTSAQWNGYEIGTAGISMGAGSPTDNYGVLGHSNGVGVRGEHSDDADSWGELGTDGTGVMGHGSTYGIQGIADTGIATGVRGVGSVYGVSGENTSAIGGGVVGNAMSATGSTYGVLGFNSSNAGVGVQGQANSASGSTIGVHGTAVSLDGIGVKGEGDEAGVWGETDYSGGYGVYAYNSSAAGSPVAIRGLVGPSAGSGAGVEGESLDTSGITYGVRGYINSDFGRGVYGKSNSGSGFGIGVYGRSDGSTGTGVYGWSSDDTGFALGVLGETDSSNGYGVFSQGDSGATGSKSFLQPHPTDPSKQIRFYCLEGNEAGTYFRGSSQLSGGSATIEVPEEFRLASEVDGITVQLTPRGPNAGLWVERQDLETLVVRGNGHVAFDYQVNGVRRGYAQVDVIEVNRAWVPEERGVPFGTQYPESIRSLLIGNGILNADYTPNEALAEELGWELREPEDREEELHQR